MPTHVLGPLASPACESCGQKTRFVGLESDQEHSGADLCTYECSTCGHHQTISVPRTNDQESDSARPRL